MTDMSALRQPHLSIRTLNDERDINLHSRVRWTWANHVFLEAFYDKETGAIEIYTSDPVVIRPKVTNVFQVSLELHPQIAEALSKP